MALAVTTEQEQLAEAVRNFAARHAPLSQARSAAATVEQGTIPSWWAPLVAQGFQAVHLPEDVGGQGGNLPDVACVLEAAGASGLSGPLLSTVMAGAVGGMADASASADLLGELASGTTAAVVLPERSDFEAVGDGDGWIVTGTSRLTLGVCSAQRIILSASIDRSDTMWFAVDAESNQVKVESRHGTDLTTDVGIVHLSGYRVGAEAVLRKLDSDRVRCLVAALTACSSAGAVRWAVESVTDYIRTREQFGKPIGSFQALQHKAAALLVNADLAAAAAWDGVRAASESIEQHRLATAAAVLMAVSPAPELVLDALTMFGAIGYTWEHDLHLFWRRATSLAASLGPLIRWNAEMGELACAHRRSTALNLGDLEDDFRADVAVALDEATRVENSRPSRQESERREFDIGARRNLLAAKGLVAPYLPAPWGRGASPLQQLIIAEEYTKRPQLLRPRLGIAEWIVPTILIAGTDVHRERFAEPTLRGELGWCQLFSEPGAGSDLASLSTRAVRVDGGWRVNGQKIWTSLANKSDYGALLARTDPDQRKHKGLSYFILDMRSEGVDVRPIKQATGRAEFNEVFLTDVFVPDDMMVGNPGDGWSLAIATMAHERTAISKFVEIDRAVALRVAADVEGSDQDAVRRTLGEIDAYTNALKALVLRETLRQAEGQVAGPASSIAKFAFSVLLRRAAAATLAVAGQHAIVEDSDPEVFTSYFDLPAELIGGGTTEIQLTIIAQMILGLPRG